MYAAIRHPRGRKAAAKRAPMRTFGEIKISQHPGGPKQRPPKGKHATDETIGMNGAARDALLNIEAATSPPPREVGIHALARWDARKGGEVVK